MLCDAGQGALLHIAWCVKRWLISLNSQNELILRLIERLVQVEGKLETLLASSEPDRQQTDLDFCPSLESEQRNSKAEPPTPSPAVNGSSSLKPLLPAGGLWSNDSLETSSLADSLRTSASRDNETPDTHQHLPISPEDVIHKSQYLRKTPFSCEECRQPLPDLLVDTEQTKPSDIMPYWTTFFYTPAPYFRSYVIRLHIKWHL
jgi:hypothetical protein